MNEISLYVCRCRRNIRLSVRQHDVLKNYLTVAIFGYNLPMQDVSRVLMHTFDEVGHWKMHE